MTASPGISETSVMAITSPISVLKPYSELIAMVIGFPPVTVRIRANTTSTHENMKQKNAVTPMPGAISGSNCLIMKSRQVIPVKEWRFHPVPSVRRK